jgi:hypothetical protein
MKTCPNCGIALPDSFPVCDCGAKVPVPPRADSGPIRAPSLKARTQQKVERRLLGFVCFALVFSLLVHFAVRSAEKPSSGELGADILIHVLLFATLATLGSRVLRAAPETSRGGWIFVIILGAAAGLAEVAIRLPKERAPRFADSETSAPSPALAAVAAGPEFAPLDPSTSLEAAQAPSATPRPVPVFNPNELLLKSRLTMVKVQQERQFADIEGSRWALATKNGDLEKRRALTPQDLAKFLALQADYLKSVDEGLTVWEEAEKKNVDISSVFAGSVDANPGLWRAFAEFMRLSHRYHQLLAENWPEYRRQGIKPPSGEPKPWQQQAQAWDKEMDAMLAKMKADFGPKK